MKHSDYQLIEITPGVFSIRSLPETETFHPVVGPVQEAQALYVNPLQLPERMDRAGDVLRIWDVGLGAAANAVTVIESLRDTEGRLEIWSFDRTLAPLLFGLEHAEELKYLNGWEETVALLAQVGAVTLQRGRCQVDWKLVTGDFPALCQSKQSWEWPQPHVILFDPFSPAKNPAMWTLPLFERMYALVRNGPPCVLSSYSRSTMVRATLLSAGFSVGYGAATGEKEQTTFASNVLEELRKPLGKEWLKRARASTSAEPLHEPVYRQSKLLPETLIRLERHPQFSAQSAKGVKLGGEMGVSLHEEET